MFATAPASAQASGSWTLECKGNTSGVVSWDWLLDSTPISGASGSAACSGTMTLTGTSARPANANGFVGVLYVSAGDKANTKLATKSFDAIKSFQVHLSTGASDRVCVPEPESRNCVWVHFLEGAHFSIQG